MPVDRGTGPRSRWRAPWVVAGAAVAVAGVVAVMMRLAVATSEPSSAAPTSVSGRSGCGNRQEPVLRVLQFNIRAAMSGNGDVNLARIAAEIKAVRPDLVSLNEVDSMTRRTRADEPAYLAGATGLHVVYGPNLVYDGGPFGNAVLSRYPVVDSHNLRLPGTPGLEPRGLLTVIVSVDGRRVAFASTHLSDRDAGRQSRLLQAQAVARAVRSVGAPAILAGDLNSVPDDLPARILRRDLLDAQEEAGTGTGETYPQTNPTSRFDYVFFDPRLAAVPGSTRVRASESSDHRSVVTELTLPTRHGC